MASPATPTSETNRVSIEQIADGIEKHIAAKTRADGGYFKLPHQGSELHLKLVRVHLEYLSDLGGGIQFACVDLVGTAGPVYDVDFFQAFTTRALRSPAEDLAVTFDRVPIGRWGHSVQKCSLPSVSHSPPFPL